MIFKEFILIALTFILLIPFVQKEFRHWMISLVVGMFCMFVAGDINSLLLDKFTGSFENFTCMISPITEEIIKFIPVFFICRFLVDDRKNAFGCSCAIGLGFAVMENLLYLIQFTESFTVFNTIVRALSSAAAHGLSGYIIAIGILRAKKYKTGSISCFFATLCVNIVQHSIYNVMNAYAYPGVVFISMGFIYFGLLFILHSEQRKESDKKDY